MAQRGRISEEAANKAFELESAMDQLIAAIGVSREVLLGITADGIVTNDEMAALLVALADQDARAESVDQLSDELTDLTDNVDAAIAIAIATARTGVKGERRRRLLEEVRNDYPATEPAVAAAA